VEHHGRSLRDKTIPSGPANVKIMWQVSLARFREGSEPCKLAPEQVHLRCVAVVYRSPRQDGVWRGRL
jgi:hypothetical protein